MTQGDAQAARLLDPKTHRGELEVIDSIVSVAAEMRAVEMLAQINGWFDAGLVDLLFISKAEFHQDVARPFITCRDTPDGHINGYVSDAQAEMGWWAGFDDEPVKKKLPVETKKLHQLSSRCAPNPRSAAIIPVPVVVEKNTRSAAVQIDLCYLNSSLLRRFHKGYSLKCCLLSP